MCSTHKQSIFCISARFCLPVIFSRRFAVPFFTNPIASTTTGIIDIFNCHILSTSIWRSLYLDSFSNYLLEIFTTIRNVKSISLRVFSLWSFIAMSGLFACIVLSVWIEKSHKTVALSVSATFCDLGSYQFLAYGALQYWHIFQ